MNMTVQYFTVKKITRFGVYEKFLRTIHVYISQILKRKRQHGIIVPRNSWSCNQYNNQR